MSALISRMARQISTSPSINKAIVIDQQISPRRRAFWACVAMGVLACALPVIAQEPPTTRPLSTFGAIDLRGRVVESIRIVGNRQVSTPVILNVVRTREGDKYDPTTVEDDYQRIFALRKFSNVEAKIEPTDTGVIVVFIVSEQKQIRDILYRGNFAISTEQLQDTVDIRTGESIDRFRIAIARRAIEEFYKSKNYPFAHVDVPPEPLAERGEVVFNVVEGPNVRIRKTTFVGNKSFTDDKLKDQIKTRWWIWIFRPGTFDPETIEQDVASVRRFYENKGFFDARVGRKLIFSPDQTEMQVDFVVDEGVRYQVERITFKGNTSVSESDIRARIKLNEGRFYDNELLQRDVREIVRAYSPFGYIYQPGSTDPDYLNINTKTVFRREAGKVELVYEINEGRPFRLGRVLVKGNAKTQDKVILREMRVAPGQLYDSAEISDATDRLRGTPFFTSVTMTPVGEDPETRDLLIEVQEGRTASFNVGAGINSNGGVGGNLTYEQRNFDIANLPSSYRDLFSEKAFTGAGQRFRVSLEPGTEQTNASVLFTEPYLFDQPYSLTTEAYYRDRQREHYDDTRLGGRLSFGKRFDYIYSGQVTFKGEQVQIHSIEDKPIRADEILDAAGYSVLTSVGFQLRRDTTNRGFLPSKGTTTTAAVEAFGWLGGDYDFYKFSLGWDRYFTVGEDLLDRKTILAIRADTGYITGDAPFFERYYGGGIGSIRGFRFRGVSPRSGLDDDPVGGDFIATYSLELSFPLAGETLRGVVFTDGGTVEPDFEVGTIRTSVGFGFRLTLPLFGQAPLALDFGFPLTRDSDDEEQLISFSFGITQ